MSVSTISNATSATDLAPAAPQTGTTDLGEDTFLTLLTTQMQYQDPLDPMSNADFVAQLAQFSSLEELKTLGAGMESLYLVNVSMNNASMVNLLGQNVVAASDTIHYDGEGAQTIDYDADAAAESATITITDSDGGVVYTGDMGALAEGEGTWTWDGTATDGSAVPEGDYTVTITGTDANGGDVSVTNLIEGIVTDMDYSTGSPTPEVNGVAIDIGAIVRLSTPEGE